MPVMSTTDGVLDAAGGLAETGPNTESSSSPSWQSSVGPPNNELSVERALNIEPFRRGFASAANGTGAC